MTMLHRSALAVLLCSPAFSGAPLPDIRSVSPDLETPPMTEQEPGPGRRVRDTLPAYRGTDVHHALYLPRDWRPGHRYPVIVEYAGNGGYANAFGDRCAGTVDGCNLGFGISGGEGFIWLCVPFVSRDGSRNEPLWWGDAEATVAYCRDAVARVCGEFGGDPDALILAGFSRGAIACNFIGLHDDGIAPLWRAFICHSHYDGIREWPYPGADRDSAGERFARLQGRPQFISHEGSVEETRAVLADRAPPGTLTFLALPYRNHTDAWVLRDIPERRALREWLAGVLGGEPVPEGP